MNTDQEETGICVVCVPIVFRLSLLVLQILFWFSIPWVVYATCGYLALLLVLGRFVRRPATHSDVTPTVSLLIAARNEEAVIAAKLENSLALAAPSPPGSRRRPVPLSAGRRRLSRPAQRAKHRPPAPLRLSHPRPR